MPLRYQTFLKLRGVMTAKGYSQDDLAKELLVKPLTISQRFTCRVPWNIVEMYAVMDWLDLPHDQMHIYFPPGGIAQSEGSVT